MHHRGMIGMCMHKGIPEVLTALPLGMEYNRLYLNCHGMSCDSIWKTCCRMFKTAEVLHSTKAVKSMKTQSLKTAIISEMSQMKSVLILFLIILHGYKD